MRELDGHPDDIYSVSWSPDGTRLATVGYGGHLFVWDAGVGEDVSRQRLDPGIRTYGVWLFARRQAAGHGGIGQQDSYPSNSRDGPTRDGAAGLRGTTPVVSH